MKLHSPKCSHYVIHAGLESFASWWKNIFSVVKTAPAKIVFVGKITFCQEIVMKNLLRIYTDI